MSSIELIRQHTLTGLELVGTAAFALSGVLVAMRKRRQRIEPDRELVALGASNMGAALTGGFPVTGGFARSVVNFDAGAQTPAAGAFTALGILLAAVLLTPALYFVPQATLSATIVVAVLSLVDLRILRSTWDYSRADFSAVVLTLLVTLAAGVEAGLVAGVALSLSLYLFKTSRPHIAEVGWVPGTEHFRSVLRHKVKVSERLASLRVDESLYFASALESLEAINQRLADAGVCLHMSEVKGPVMDRLQGTDLLNHLTC